MFNMRWGRGLALPCVLLTIPTHCSANRSPDWDEASVNRGTRKQQRGHSTLLDVEDSRDQQQGGHRDLGADQDAVFVGHNGHFQRIRNGWDTQDLLGDGHGHSRHHKPRLERDYDSEGKKGEKEALEGPNGMDFATAVLLLAFAGICMTALYLLNSSDPQIKNYAYKLIFYMSSIKCTLDMVHFQSGGLVVNLLVRVCHFVKWQAALVLLVPLLVWFFGITKIHVNFKGNRDKIFMFVFIAAHNAGFLGEQIMEKIEDPLAEKMGIARYWACLLLAAISIVFFKVLDLLCLRIFDDALPEDEELRDSILEGEVDASAIVFGFLVREAWIALSGAPGLYEEREAAIDHTDHEMFVIWCGWAITGAIFLIAAILHMKTDMKFGLVSHLSMGWSFTTVVAFRWAVYQYWYYLTPGSEEDAVKYYDSPALKKSVSATLLSFPCILCILIMDWLADRNLLSEQTTEEILYNTSLTLSVSWEQAFKVASNTIFAAFHTSNAYYKCVWKFSLAFLICLVILPGMLWYIVPHARLPVPSRWQPQGGRKSTSVHSGENAAPSSENAATG